MEIPQLIEMLPAQRDLDDAQLKALLETDRMDQALFAAADHRRRAVYGNDVYIRGLIEFTNHCRNNCYYCGIRRDNAKADRYRLRRKEILASCAEGYGFGFRTFVLQGGEESAQCRGCLESRVRSAGYKIVTSIGNPAEEKESC